MRGNPWTPEMIARLEELWTNGKTASACAFILNQETRLTISRNAVISRVHRSNCFGQPPRFKNPVSRATYKSRHKAFPPNPVATSYACAEAVAFSPPVPIPAARSEGVFSVLDLREGKCKYPTGDHPTLLHSFCMADAPGGWPYCAEHQRLSHDPRLMRWNEMKQVSGVG